MNRNSTGKCIAQPQSNLQQVRRPVTEGSSQSLERCGPVLEEVRAGLDGLRHQRPNGPHLAARLAVLQRDLQRFSVLLESSAAFYGSWQRLRASLTGGYGTNGDPVSAERPARLKIDL